MKIEAAEHFRAAHEEAQLVRDDRAQVAFVGRSNVGKSSLMNRLLGRKGLARTSSTPGRTRAVHYFLVNQRFYFVDLPGYGYAKVSRADRRSWAELVGHYFENKPVPPLVIQIVDSKVGATPLDVEARDYLEALEIPSVVAATKIDRLPRSRRGKALADIGRTLDLTLAAEGGWQARHGDGRIVAVSSQSGEGIKELWNEITGFLRAGPVTADGERNG